MPVDIALPDVAASIKAFRQAVLDGGRDPDKVEVTLVVMNTPTADLLKRYRDIGIQRVNIGVGVDNWERPEVVMPMIEKFARLIPELAA